MKALVSIHKQQFSTLLGRKQSHSVNFVRCFAQSAKVVKTDKKDQKSVQTKPQKKVIKREPQPPPRMQTEFPNILKDVPAEIKNVFAHPLFSNYKIHPLSTKKSHKVQRKRAVEFRKRIREEDAKLQTPQQELDKLMAKRPTTTVTPEDVEEAYKIVTDKKKGLPYYFMQHEGLFEEAEAVDNKGDSETARKMLPPIGKMGIPHPLYPKITMSVADFETHGIYEHPYLAKLPDEELIPIIYNQLKERGIPVIDFNDSNSSNSPVKQDVGGYQKLPGLFDEEEHHPIHIDVLDRIQDASKGTKKVKPTLLSQRHPLMFITQHFPKRPATDDLSFITRKARLQIKVSELALPKKIQKRFLKMVGKRYNQETDTLKLVSDRFDSQQDNFLYVKKLLQELLHEAWKIHKHYVSISQVKKYLGVDPGDYVFFSNKRAIFRGIPDNKAEPILEKVESIESKLKGALPKMPPPPKPAFRPDYFVKITEENNPIHYTYTEENLVPQQPKTPSPTKTKST